MVTTGLSGNEIFCLRKLGYYPGEILVGNSVWSLGFMGSLSSGLRNLVGGEVEQVTQLVSSGRAYALSRLEAEAQQKHGLGICGVSSEFIHHVGSGNIEFLSIGSAIHSGSQSQDELSFSSSIDGNEMFCNHESGYSSKRFVFGNVAYSRGLGRSMVGAFKTLGRGEIKEYSDIYNHTRHLTLDRIVQEAKRNSANAVLNIETKILPYSSGINEIIMIGTASHNPSLPQNYMENPITSDLSSSELWSITNMGMIPIKLLLGTSIYSLGLVGSVTSIFKSFVKGEINELTALIYGAREKAIGLINQEAQAIGADDILGTKTYMYDLGQGLIEFLAIGTAVKKVDYVKTNSDTLLPQAIIEDRDTYFDYPAFDFGSINNPSI